MIYLVKNFKLSFYSSIFEPILVNIVPYKKQTNCSPTKKIFRNRPNKKEQSE